VTQLLYSEEQRKREAFDKAMISLKRTTLPKLINSNLTAFSTKAATDKNLIPHDK
jgi:glutaredoxin 2